MPFSPPALAARATVRTLSSAIFQHASSKKAVARGAADGNPGEIMFQPGEPDLLQVVDPFFHPVFIQRPRDEHFMPERDIQLAVFELPGEFDGDAVERTAFFDQIDVGAQKRGIGTFAQRDQLRPGRKQD